MKCPTSDISPFGSGRGHNTLHCALQRPRAPQRALKNNKLSKHVISRIVVFFRVWRLGPTPFTSIPFKGCYRVPDKSYVFFGFGWTQNTTWLYIGAGGQAWITELFFRRQLLPTSDISLFGNS